jgi:hypothetical protein
MHRGAGYDYRRTFVRYYRKYGTQAQVPAIAMASSYHQLRNTRDGLQQLMSDKI